MTLNDFIETKLRSSFMGYITDQLIEGDDKKLEDYFRSALRECGELTVESVRPFVEEDGTISDTLEECHDKCGMWLGTNPTNV